MNELLQEMRENIQILMETAEVLENQIRRLQSLSPEEAREFIQYHQEALRDRNIAIDPSKREEVLPITEQHTERTQRKRKRSVMSKI
ncbi:MAG: hypothetical protein ACLTPC_03175 [Lacrimispora saccharolytica]